MNEQQTKEFVTLWNQMHLNDYTYMIYVRPDEVSWNEYDAPVISLSLIEEALKQLRSNHENH